MNRKITFRFELLRGGAYYGLLRADMSKTPTINMDDSAAIKTSFSGTFAPYALNANNEQIDVNWLSDEIQPFMVIDGVDYPLGIYLVAKAEETQKMNTRLVTLQCFDRGIKVRDMRVENTLYWPRNTLYLDAIVQLLNASGIGAIIKTDTAAALSEAREWAIGTSFLDVVNELLSEINYKNLWFNESGEAVLEPVAVPEASYAQNEFDFTDPDSMVIPEFSITSDIYERGNVFIVSCANPEKSGNMVATAVNNNPQSPLSIQKRGRRIVQAESVNNIESQSALQEYAEWLRDKSLFAGETVKITTGLRPGFGIAQTVSIKNKDGVTTGIEHAFTMPLQVGGKMTHTIERVIYNLE